MEQTEGESATDLPSSEGQTDITEDPQQVVEEEASEHQENPAVTETGVDSAEEAQLDKQETSTDAPVVEEEPEISVDPAVVEKLTTGLLGLYLPNLQKAKGSLNEVLHNQEVLIETVTQENAKFTESAAMRELIDTMKDARVYHAKLLNLKREMNGLMDKSVKLKKRAVKLQQQKHKEIIEKAVQRDQELDREKLLTAKDRSRLPATFKRAVKLQQQKHKEVLEKAVQRDRELDREKLLTAKVVRADAKREREPDT